MNLVTITSPASPAAEAYRTLRTNLHFASLESPLKTLLVTAPDAGEGKSLVVANLAVVFAQAERSVIVVDADLRAPQQHALFGVDNAVGLAQVLAGEVAAPPLQSTRHANLRVLPSGAKRDNPADLIYSARMAQTLATLAGQAEIVIVDTPPLGEISDAAILASQVDGVLLAISAGKTRREHAQAVKETLTRARARVLGAVMMNV
ncbi:MAG: CpsD/CapB family tyrosine-protein kinase [Thermoflexales bacterium]|nr:CpsD/CapB family tyrosine-protein kinase [Thermoflexales bacterium]